MQFLLFGIEFWKSLINWNQLIDDGLISPQDIQIFKMVETAQEGIFR
jgi:predicted Rossmann-fold nucleotide-binding protein